MESLKTTPIFQMNAYFIQLVPENILVFLQGVELNEDVFLVLVAIVV